MEVRNLVRTIVYDPKVDKFLLIKALKGYWQNPQGGILENESEEAACHRELLEETGLRGELKLESRVFIEYDTERKGKPIHTRLAAFLYIADSCDKVVLSNEHTDFKWVSYDAAWNSMDKYPEQRIVFDQVLDSKCFCN